MSKSRSFKRKLHYNGKDYFWSVRSGYLIIWNKTDGKPVGRYSYTNHFDEGDMLHTPVTPAMVKEYIDNEQ